MHQTHICSTSPRMLYEFHAWQNGKRSGSVHATYMLYGTRKAAQTNGHSQKEGDVEMASSPPEPEVVSDDGPVVTLSVVAEESLKGTIYCRKLLTSRSFVNNPTYRRSFAI